MKCPRCKDNDLAKPKVMNCLSRRDNKTYICRQCGYEEVAIDNGMAATPNEKRFVGRTARQGAVGEMGA